MKVTDPSGRTWTVRRELLRRPRFRGFGRPRLDAVGDVAASSGGSDLTDLVIGIVLVITLVLVTVAFVWPLILLLLELIAATVLLVVRFFLGRWTVVAQTPGERWSWPVRGRERSAAFVAEVENAIRTGAALPAGASR